MDLQVEGLDFPLGEEFLLQKSEVPQGLPPNGGENCISALCPSDNSGFCGALKKTDQRKELTPHLWFCFRKSRRVAIGIASGVRIALLNIADSSWCWRNGCCGNDRSELDTRTLEPRSLNPSWLILNETNLTQRSWTSESLTNDVGTISLPQGGGLVGKGRRVVSESQ